MLGRDEWIPTLSNCKYFKRIINSSDNESHIFIPFRIESKHQVTILGGLNELCVRFHGPRESNLFYFSIEWLHNESRNIF